jgi:hypothetical protein
MKKTLLALATSAVLAVATLAPTTADARCRGCGIAAGVLGGLIIGGAIANANRPAYAYPAYPAYAPAPGYTVYHGYHAHVPVDCPGGHWARRPVRDPYGNVVGWSRPRFICPAY